MYKTVLEKLIRLFRLWRDSFVISRYFNKDWYLDNNLDVKAENFDPVTHYLRHGWREGRNPTSGFVTDYYLDLYSDVRLAGINPFVHYIRNGVKEGRSACGISVPESKIIQEYRPFEVHARAFHSVQDQSFPAEVENAKELFVIVIPEHNDMSGGIYSFFSIAKTVYDLRMKHNYAVVVMTRGNLYDVTFVRQRNFRNSEDVFRFEQITRCKNARTIYLQIPEYAAPDFVSNLPEDVLYYLKSREKLYINILNQKIDIMPEREDFDDLRAIADEVTQSVAHHAYFSQEFSDRYNLPTLLLPAFTDLSNYATANFDDKEKLIIYSPDYAPWKEDVLQLLRRDLPEYELREIRGVTFDKFMDLATRCRFSITFGEGFDGYLAQPIHQGGVSFAVFNEEFFPSSELLEFKNIFASAEEFLERIVPTIKMLESSISEYIDCNRRMIAVYDALYSREEYIERVLKLVRREFEYYPLHMYECSASWKVQTNEGRSIY